MVLEIKSSKKSLKPNIKIRALEIDKIILLYEPKRQKPTNG